MYSAMTPLAQNIKLAVETDDKETWQRHATEFQRRNQTKRQRKKMKLNSTDHRRVEKMLRSEKRIYINN